MAGQTAERFRQIFHDIAHSWYFRLWGLLWVLFALVVFSGLIILGKASNTAAKDRDVVTWMENATSIQFPRIHFRTDHRGNETFEYYSCNCEGQILTAMPCAAWKGVVPPMEQCVAFDTDSYYAVNDHTRDDARVYCELITSGYGPDGNMMMAMELEGEYVFSWGGNRYSGTWFAPNDMTWIMLEKNILQASHKNPPIQLWQQTLMYHSTVSQPNLYNVTTIMGSFWVRHFDPKDTYNGWMAVGDIGGVAFFMVILHTIVMLIFGFFMSNTSTFLSGEAK